LVGLYETVSTLTGEETSEKKDMISIASKILGNIQSLLKDGQSGSKIRIAISSTGDGVASQRLAEIDVERFGWANVKVQGTKQYPYYTYESFLPFDENMSLLDRVSFEEVLHPMLGGGHAFTIQVSENAGNPEDLIRLTSEIVSNHNLGFFNYSKNYTYCQNCHKDFDGIKQKCPSCGSASLTCYVRCKNQLVPLSWCSPTQQIHINSKQAYHIAEELKKN
jgi:anaerobic ribonucleoside-triphosphate reductase